MTFDPDFKVTTVFEVKYLKNGAVLATATWLAGWWLDVTRRYCINTAKPILKLFRPSGSHIILVSSDPCADIQFETGTPSVGGVKYTGVGKIGDFRRKSPFMSETVRDDYYGTLIGSHGCRIEWYNLRWPWLTPKPGFKSRYTYKSNISKMVRFRDKVTKEH